MSGARAGRRRGGAEQGGRGGRRPESHHSHTPSSRLHGGVNLPPDESDLHFFSCIIFFVPLKSSRSFCVLSLAALLITSRLQTHARTHRKCCILTCVSLHAPHTSGEEFFFFIPFLCSWRGVRPRRHLCQGRRYLHAASNLDEQISAP